jgi:hypothetical protein
MDAAEFNMEWQKIVVGFSSDTSELKWQLYFEEVGHWSALEFRAAVKACLAELDWFPTIHQLKQRRPVERKTVDWWDQEAGISEVPRIENETNSAIDDLSRDEVYQLFRSLYDDGAKWHDPDKAATWLTDNFFSGRCRWKDDLRLVLADQLAGSESKAVPF